MNYEGFRALAGHMFDEIPPVFRDGVSGLVVEPRACPHPSLPGIHTLGECVTEHWPDGLGGQGETQSHIVLYHGSFQSLAGEDPMFDWEAELWETLLHELLHHREASADEDGLDRFDWAMDQNFRRLAGCAFDPAFYASLPPGTDGAVRVGGETFLETTASPRDTAIRFHWRGREYGLQVPPTERPAWIRVRNLGGGRVWIIVRRRLPWWRRLVSGQRLETLTLDRRALPAPVG
jgi:predicted Zn-dependent protease with MMP-like domain